ncbi:MAG: hypothetical protein OXF01_07555 [Gemmatimonadetes bacterium]|nr:hypothetical protein [Gemmatimonadota bacterium]
MPPAVSGRVVDATTGAAVEGAGVALVRVRDGVVDSTRMEAVTVVVGAPVASVLADRWFRGRKR